MQRIRLAVVVTLFAAVLPGCGQAVSNPGPVGICQVPVMPGSTLLEATSGGAQVGEALGALYSVTINGWSYTTEKSLAEIQEFYVAKYPNADVDVGTAGEYEEGDDDEEDMDDEIKLPPDTIVEVRLHIPPSDSSVEQLTIAIYEKSYEISETVRD